MPAEAMGVGFLQLELTGVCAARGGVLATELPSFTRAVGTLKP